MGADVEWITVTCIIRSCGQSTPSRTTNWPPRRVRNSGTGSDSRGHKHKNRRHLSSPLSKHVGTQSGQLEENAAACNATNGHRSSSLLPNAHQIFRPCVKWPETATRSLDGAVSHSHLTCDRPQSCCERRVAVLCKQCCHVTQ